MVSKRTFLLQRIRAVLKTVAPGVVYSFPFPQFSAQTAVTTDLKERVYDKQRPLDKIDRMSTPSVEVLTSDSGQDQFVYLDNEMIERTLEVKLYGYIYGGAGGEATPNATLAEAALDSMDADLSLAMEAAKYWSDSSSPETSDPLTARLGAVVFTHENSWTDTNTGQAWAMLVQVWRITYTYNRREP